MAKRFISWLLNGKCEECAGTFRKWQLGQSMVFAGDSVCEQCRPIRRNSFWDAVPRRVEGYSEHIMPDGTKEYVKFVRYEKKASRP